MWWQQTTVSVFFKQQPTTKLQLSKTLWGEHNYLTPHLALQSWKGHETPSCPCYSPAFSPWIKNPGVSYCSTNCQMLKQAQLSWKSRVPLPAIRYLTGQWLPAPALLQNSFLSSLWPDKPTRTLWHKHILIFVRIASYNRNTDHLHKLQFITEQWKCKRFVFGFVWMQCILILIACFH